MRLNESLDQVRGQILLMEPLPPINKVFSLVQNDEKQRGEELLPLPSSLSTVDSTALISRMNNEMNQAFPYSNTGFNALLSWIDNNKPYQYPRNDRPVCCHCGFKGHTAEKCYKLH